MVCGFGVLMNCIVAKFNPPNSQIQKHPLDFLRQMHIRFICYKLVKVDKKECFIELSCLRYARRCSFAR